MDPVLIGEILAGLMFVGVIGVLMLGFPVAFSLAGTALIFGLVGWLLGVYDPSNYGSLVGRYIGMMTNEVLVAVPLFIFMGVMLERSGIAEEHRDHQDGAAGGVAEDLHAHLPLADLLGRL